MELRNGTPSAPPGGGAIADNSFSKQFQSTCQLTTSDQTKSQEALGEYNPFERRNVSKPTSDYGALAHMLKGCLGSGVLAMPLAFQNGGLTFGLIGTLIIIYICTHCVHMLVEASHTLCRRARIPVLDFAETAEVAFSHGPPAIRKYSSVAKKSVNAALTFSGLMGTTVVLVFICTTIQQIVENHYPDFKVDIRMYILMSYAPLLLLSMVKEFKYLVPFSIAADCAILCVIGISLFYVLRDPLPDPATRTQIAQFHQMPLFFSIVIFATEAIPIMLPVENSMKTPQHFTAGLGVLNIGMIIVTVLYAVVGFVGYLKYGDATKASITLNVLIDHPHDIEAHVTQYLIALAMIVTYVLHLMVPVPIIWGGIKHRFDEKRHTLYIYLLRYAFVTATVLLGIAVPNLGPITSLVGALCLAGLGLLLPAIIDTVTRWEEGFGPAHWILCKNILIIIFSILAIISGVYTSVLKIIAIYSGEKVDSIH